MLTSDCEEFAQSSHTNGIELLIVGGDALFAYAHPLAASGHPRNTGDLDFCIGTDPPKAEKIIRTLKDFGLGLLQLTVAVTSPNRTVHLGYLAHRIELLNGISGVDFRQCCESPLVVGVEDLELPFSSLEDFKTNKAAAGRPKDLADSDGLW